MSSIVENGNSKLDDKRNKRKVVCDGDAMATITADCCSQGIQAINNRFTLFSLFFIASLCAIPFYFRRRRPSPSSSASHTNIRSSQTSLVGYALRFTSNLTFRFHSARASPMALFSPHSFFLNRSATLCEIGLVALASVSFCASTLFSFECKSR